MQTENFQEVGKSLESLVLVQSELAVCKESLAEHDTAMILAHSATPIR